MNGKRTSKGAVSFSKNVTSARNNAQSNPLKKISFGTFDGETDNAAPMEPISQKEKPACFGQNALSLQSFPADGITTKTSFGSMPVRHLQAQVVTPTAVHAPPVAVPARLASEIPRTMSAPPKLDKKQDQMASQSEQKSYSYKHMKPQEQLPPPSQHIIPMNVQNPSPSQPPPPQGMQFSYSTNNYYPRQTHTHYPPRHSYSPQVNMNPPQKLTPGGMQNQSYSKTPPKMGHNPTQVPMIHPSWPAATFNMGYPQYPYDMTQMGNPVPTNMPGAPLQYFPGYTMQHASSYMHSPSRPNRYTASPTPYTPQTPPSKKVIIKNPETGEEIKLGQDSVTPSRKSSSPSKPSTSLQNPEKQDLLSKFNEVKISSSKTEMKVEHLEEEENLEEGATIESGLKEDNIDQEEQPQVDNQTVESTVERSETEESFEIVKDTETIEKEISESKEDEENIQMSENAKEEDITVEATPISSTPSESIEIIEKEEELTVDDLDGATETSKEKENVEEPRIVNTRTVYLLTNDFKAIQYPEGISSMAPQSSSILKYSKEFLLSFQNLCQISPPGMVSLESLNADESGNSGRGSMGGSFPRRQASRGSGVMGQIGQERIRNVPRSSEDRYYQRKDSDRMPGRSGGSSGGVNAQSGAKMNRMSSAGRQFSASHGMGQRHNRPSSGRGKPAPPPSNEPPLKLEMSENRWVPHSVVKKEKTTEESDLEELERKMKGLLNKLTLEKFQKISSQVIELGAKSSSHLARITNLIFDKALDEPNFCSIYAQLCSLINRYTDKDVAVTKDGQETTTAKMGVFFRTTLLTRCQREFEEGPKWEESGASDSVAMLTDEYYVQAKAKRHGLGLVKFIGELFKENMLTDKIMVRCISSFMASKGEKLPSEEKIESVCKLLATVGQRLERGNNDILDSIFQALSNLAITEGLPKRIKFLILDLVDLRKRSWQQLRETGPKTISDIRKDHLEQTDVRRSSSGNSSKNLPNLRQQFSGNKSMRSDSSDKRRPPDEWTKVKQRGITDTTVGDMSGIGTLSKLKNIDHVILSPGGGHTSLGSGGAKGWNSGLSNRAPSSGSRKSSPATGRKPFKEGESEATRKPGGYYDILIDQENVQESTDQENVQEAAESIPANEENEPAGEVELTPAEATKKIEATINEFLNVWDIGEAVLCIQELGSADYIPEFFRSLVTRALDAKASIQTKIIEYCKRLITEIPNITSEHIYQAYFGVMELIEDLAIDIPTIYSTFGIFVGDVCCLNLLPLEKLPEFMEPLTDSPGKTTSAHLFLSSVLKHIAEVEGENGLLKRLESSQLDFSICWAPSKRQFKMMDIYSLMLSQLEKDNLLCINPSLKYYSELKAKPIDSLSDYLKSTFNGQELSSPQFLHVLATALCVRVATHTIFPPRSRTALPFDDTHSTGAEKLLEPLWTDLQSLFQGQEEIFLFALGEYAHDIHFPEGFLQGMISILQKHHVINEHGLKKWETEHMSHAYKEAIRQQALSKYL